MDETALRPLLNVLSIAETSETYHQSGKFHHRWSSVSTIKTISILRFLATHVTLF